MGRRGLRFKNKCIKLSLIFAKHSKFKVIELFKHYRTTANKDLLTGTVRVNNLILILMGCDTIEVNLVILVNTTHPIPHHPTPLPHHPTTLLHHPPPIPPTHHPAQKWQFTPAMQQSVWEAGDPGRDIQWWVSWDTGTVFFLIWSSPSNNNYSSYTELAYFACSPSHHQHQQLFIFWFKDKHWLLFPIKIFVLRDKIWWLFSIKSCLQGWLSTSRDYWQSKIVFRQNFSTKYCFPSIEDAINGCLPTNTALFSNKSWLHQMLSSINGLLLLKRVFQKDCLLTKTVFNL